MPPDHPITTVTVAADLVEPDTVQRIRRSREWSTRLVQGLIDAAHRAGALRPDVTFGDISLMILCVSRLVPGGFTRELNDQLGHRHLELASAMLH